ncbi:MAG: UDP-N-acetylmuramate--L-alanine ligase [Bacteroidia bacterium]|nr:UDP-N-acetylmuramate--L-alanine ligase [Bacteroidia bacterium]
MNWRDAHTIYFLGIGGIGMSAIARYFRLMGKQVSGYDRTETAVTRALEAEGIRVYFNADPAHLAGAGLVVYTPAIPSDHPELVHARQTGMPLFKRSQILGQISQGAKALAVAGTHGKTTTSAMLTHLLRESGISCTAFLGGISANLGSNFVYGESDWLVVEADEYDRSFLTLHPHAAIITAMDPDHLEIYGTAAQMEAAYRQFASQSGSLLVHASLAGAGWPSAPATFGLDEGDYQATALRFGGLSVWFDVEGPGLSLHNLELQMPGAHNVLNMTAALALAHRAGAPAERLAAAVGSFRGLYRRFEVLIHRDDLTYIDDYAHHPKEIAAAVAAARALFPERKLIVVFQPHLYTRTRDLCEGFAAELSKADEVLLMEIYPAREEPIPGVTSDMLLQAMSLPASHLVARAALPDAIRAALTRPAVLLTLGAGDIDKEVSTIQQCFS